MKKVFIFPLIFLCLIFSSCQESPQDDIVVNKENQDLESHFNYTDDTNNKNSESQSSSFSEQIPGIEDNIQINIDISLTPTNSSISTYRCLPKDISMDQIKQWTKVLFGDNTIYEPSTQRSKSEIEEEILRLKQRISNEDLLLEEYSGDSASVNTYISYIEELIDSLEEEYTTAPDKVDLKETDWQFHNYEYYDTNRNIWSTNSEYALLNKSNIFQAEGEINESGLKGTIISYNRNEADYLMHNISFMYNDMNNIDTLLPEKYLTQNDAYDTAKEMVEKLGFSDWSLDSCTMFNANPENENQYEQYSFLFVPQYNNLNALYYPMMTVKNDDAYAAHYYYEHLSVIMQRGIITAVSWYSPVEITSTVSENVQLLPETEIYNRMKEYVQMKYTMATITGIPDVSVESTASININTAELKMCRIKEKNSDTFLIIPVWEFCGTIALDNAIIAEDTSLAIINALDGSIINAELGY